MSFRAKNHHSHRSNQPLKTVTQQDDGQQSLEQALNEQHQAIRQVDKVLMIVFPIMAFLLSVMTANFNWQSTVGTFLMAWLAFYAVGIRKQNVFIWLALVAIYTVVDNFFSYNGVPNVNRLTLPLGSIIAFVIIIHIFRPMLNTWFLRSKIKANHK